MEASGQTRRSRRSLRVGAVVAVALAAAFVVWLIVRDGNDNSNVTPTSTSPTSTVSPSTVVRSNQQALARISRLSHRPIFWAGPPRNMKLELTQTTGGRIYIRYLPLNVRIGDRSGRYLIVGTYPVPNAYQAIQKAARERGAHLLRLRPGVLGVYNNDAPTNVYFAARGSNLQVEVYHPDPQRALALVRSGGIRPISLKATG